MGRMSVLSKKLHVMKTGGADVAISLYTTTGECAEPNLKLQVDGTAAYAKLGDVSDSNATPLRVYRNSDSKTYAVLKEAITAIATFNMVAGKLVESEWTNVGFECGDTTGNYGSMTPNTFTYNGTTHTILSLETALSGMNKGQMWFCLLNQTNFTKIVLDINGTKYTGTTINTILSGWIFYFTPVLEFVPGNKYTVKLLSLT